LIILCLICIFRRKKGKLKDKIVPQKVRELVPESQSYMDLLAFERKLDATIMRKRLDIQEALKRPIKVPYLFSYILYF
jgi:SWI/SNF-related matrix-associated actin-dependent regulator of chromatin subfamily D